MTNEKLYNYVYRITNKLNYKIYIGCHQTNNLDDGYMGSGVHIQRAYKKYGVENFVKEILEFYPDMKTMFDAEAKIVDREFIKNDSNYNLAEGGKGGFKGRECYDSQTRSAKISQASCNKVLAKTKNGQIIKVDIFDPRLVTKELVGITKGQATVKDVHGNISKVLVDDPRLATGELVGNTKGLAVMKDKDGKRIQVLVDDPRIATGELVGNTKGCTQTADSNKKRSDKLLGRKVSHTLVTCVFCRKTTTLTNNTRWHKTCCLQNKI